MSEFDKDFAEVRDQRRLKEDEEHIPGVQIKKGTKRDFILYVGYPDSQWKDRWYKRGSYAKLEDAEKAIETLRNKPMCNYDCSVKIIHKEGKKSTVVKEEALVFSAFRELLKKRKMKFKQGDDNEK